MFSRATVAIWCGVLLLLAFSVTACDGGPRVDPETMARDYAAAVFEGRADDAKAMALAGHEAEDEFRAKTDEAIALFARYEVQEVKLVSTRPWVGAESGEVDRRAEMQFDFREKASDESWRIGLLYLRITSSSGRWGVTDVIPSRPDR
jgi:hypothetical protein